MGSGTIDVGVVIGYKYYLGMHMVVCHGPVNSINAIYAGERVAYGTAVTYDGVEDPIKSIDIDKPNLFGGDKKEGGIVGPVDIMFGADDQDQSDYLLEQDGINSTNLPNFKGVVSCVLKRVNVGSISPYIKPWWFIVCRLAAEDWYTKSAINPIGSNKSANGAHIIYEALTNSDWGLGLSTALIDDDAFKAAADTLYSENFGLSFVLSGQDDMSSLIQFVLRHINGVVYESNTTGKFVLKLFRDDYSVGSLPVFDESNIIELESFQRPSFAEMVNEIIITYRRRGDTKDSVATFQDLASIQAQGGYIVSQSLQFPGLDNADTAALVGMRELKQHSTPLAQVRLIVNRDGWDVNPGDPIVLNWPTLGVSTLVLRVVRANYGSIQDGQVTLECIEDIFGLPSASYVSPQEPVWTDPVSDPVAVTTAKLSEATYYELAANVPKALVDADDLGPTDSYLIFLADKPITSPSYQLWARAGAASYKYRITGRYTPNVNLVDELYYTDTTNISTTTMPFEATFVEIGSYGFINDEIVRIDAIDTINNLVTLGRGCIDTIPEIHAAGSTLWFGQNFWALDLGPFGAETVNAKALTQTGVGLLDIGDATEETYTLVGRQYKPYPVANVTMGDLDWSFPAQMYGIISGTPGIRFKWADRNRLQQTVPDDILDWYDAGVTIEPSTTYELSLYGEVDLYLSASRVVEPASGNQYDWTNEVADSNLPVFDPPGLTDPDSDKHYDLHMCLANTSRYKLGSSGTADASVNVTYSDGWASFDGTAYIEVSNGVGGSGWTAISLLFNPTDAGNDEQVIIGAYGDLDPQTVPPTNWGPLVTISWKRSTNAIIVHKECSYTGTEIVGYARPGVNNELFIWFLEPYYETTPPDPPGEPTTPGEIKVYMNNRLIHSSSLLWGLPGMDKPWILGSGWSDETTRYNYFQGKMTDFRLWTPPTGAEVVSTDIWSATASRVNRSFRAKIVTSRDVNSLQTYDYTVPYRAGWGISWGEDWNGRF